MPKKTLFGFVDGAVVKIEVSEEVGDRLTIARLKLGWREADMVAWMVSHLPHGVHDLTEDHVRRFLDNLERIYGLEGVKLPDIRIKGEDKISH